MAKLIFINFRHGISGASPRGWCGGRLLLRMTNVWQSALRWMPEDKLRCWLDVFRPKVYYEDCYLRRLDGTGLAQLNYLSIYNVDI